MIRPNLCMHLDTVVVPGEDEPMIMSWMPALQPDEQDLVHVCLTKRKGWQTERRMRQCRLVDGVWHDEGPAPSMADHSWHPDLCDSINAQIRVARNVIAAIGHCSYVDVIIDAENKGEDGSVLRSTALFSKRSHPETGMGMGFVDESTLDRVPYVRSVERMGLLLADLLDISVDDGSAVVDATFDMRIGPNDLHVFCGPDNESGVYLTSKMVDGEWRHHTEIVAPRRDDGIVETMKQTIDPLRHLMACRNDVGKIGMKLHEGIIVDSVSDEGGSEDQGESVTFAIRPGTLFGKGD